MKSQKTWQIVLSGVGGQGLVLGGHLLGQAASTFESAQATMIMSYGAESRGTFTKAEVIVSDQPIDFPEVLAPDAVVALAQVAYNRYVDQLGENTILLYDSETIRKAPSKADQRGHPILQVASEAGGPLSANLAALGMLVALTGLVEADSLIKAIEARFAKNPEVAARNVLSFQKGTEYIKKHGQ